MHRNISVYQVVSFTVFSFVSYMHIHMPLRMYWLRLFFVIFIILTMAMFITSQRFICLQSFMFASPAVSDLNQNKKKNLENAIYHPSQTRVTFWPYLHTKLARSLVHHKLKVIISLSTHIMLAHQGHPYTQYYCTV